MAGATVPIHERSFEDLLAEAVSFHGHLCPGHVLGVRMTLAGCREAGVADPRAAGKSLVIVVEIDRCATDAIQALTGVRVAARETARALAARLVPAARGSTTSAKSAVTGPCCAARAGGAHGPWETPVLILDVHRSDRWNDDRERILGAVWHRSCALRSS
jgi:hypothetical protein